MNQQTHVTRWSIVKLPEDLLLNSDSTLTRLKVWCHPPPTNEYDHHHKSPLPAWWQIHPALIRGDIYARWSCCKTVANFVNLATKKQKKNTEKKWGRDWNLSATTIQRCGVIYAGICISHDIPNRCQLVAGGFALYGEGQVTWGQLKWA